MERAPRILEKSFAFLIALCILSGRWGFSRLTDGKPSLYLEPRFYIVSFVVLVTAIYLYCLGRTAPAGTGHADSSALKWVYGTQMALFVFLFFSFSWSRDYEVAANKAYEVVILIVLSTSMFLFLMSGAGDRLLSPFWKSTVVLCGVLAGLAIAELLTGDSNRLAILGGGPNVFSRLMGLLCIAGLSFSRKSGTRVIWLFPIVAGGLLALLSGSRGGVIALLFALAAFCWSGRVRTRDAVSAIVSGSVIVAGVLFFTSIGDQIVSIFQERFIKLLIEERYTSYRGELYQFAVEMGKSSWIAGTGLAGFQARYPEFYPHNIFLECFSEGGFIGLVLVLLAVTPPIYYGLRRKSFVDVPAFASFVLILVASQFSGDLYDNRGVFLFALFELVKSGKENWNTARAGRG